MPSICLLIYRLWKSRLADFFFQFLICLILAIGTGKLHRLRGHQPVINYLRGVLLAMASLCFFIAVKYMSVATAISIFFVEPMILTILAAVILKEHIGPRRIGAIIVGLTGALIILRPSLAEIGLVSLLPVCTAILFSFYLVLNRLYPVTDDLLTIQFSAGLAGSALPRPCAHLGHLVGGRRHPICCARPLANRAPNPAWTDLVCWPRLGSLSLSTRQCKLAGAIAICRNSQCDRFSDIWFFRDFPDGPTWIGIALIIGSGLYITYRERKISQNSDQTGPGYTSMR